jgi:hypothetical protein
MLPYAGFMLWAKEDGQPPYPGCWRRCRRLPHLIVCDAILRSHHSTLPSQPTEASSWPSAHAPVDLC